MPNNMVLLACLSCALSPPRCVGRVIEAMLSMSGRVTMRGLSRWASKAAVIGRSNVFQYQLELVSAQLAFHSPSCAGCR